jgi:DNA-binding Lrp family transcriptional regulator
MSYEQIGQKMGKSKSWVSGELKKLKERIIKKIEENNL